MISAGADWMVPGAINEGGPAPADGPAREGVVLEFIWPVYRPKTKSARETF